ncbi:hypothetical protein F2P56_016222 [Juglans regia]|uniref:FCS-Like Zinc finger 17-like n=2 Tax=Juglans regia TaxID=51240 RepID=A0A2I4DRW2_JUGRE|nr:FCS-Like Zinc finger 17-like [Juglans regia]KAF5466281.1 hypothetical protein F2P56_016222 [Juglans regia]
MVLSFKSPFIKLEDKERNQEENMHNKAGYAGHKSSEKNSSAVGLRILIQISQDESNIFLKSAFRSQPTSQSHHLRTKPPESCFLKTCQLCNKKLSLDKDVYMYRGDQGFCSIECRNRQIVLDEIRELETSTKRMMASYRHCCSSGRRETQILLEEFRQRHEHRPIPSRGN